MLASVAASAGLPGGRLRRVQRLRKTRRQPQVCRGVRQRVLQQEAAGRPDALRGLLEVSHQFYENGAFFWHGPTVHSADRPVRDRPPYGRLGLRDFRERPFHALR